MKKQWIQDHVAIITGGGSGIGRAIARKAAKAGALAVIADIDEEAGQETVSLIAEQEGKGVFLKTDVTNPDQIVVKI